MLKKLILGILILVLPVSIYFTVQKTFVKEDPIFLLENINKISKNDFDGDGLSDFVNINYNSMSNKTSYTIRPSSNPSVLQSQVFDGKYDFHTSGKWFLDDNKYYPVVIKSTPHTPLEWVFKNPTGQEVRVYFGYSGDIVPNQGDIDCDGRTDIITTRTNVPGYWNRFRVWYFALTTGGPALEFIFGLDTDKIGVADMDGDGCDDIVVLRESEFNWYYTSLSNRNSSPIPVQWGLPGDKHLLPADINHDGLADFIVVRAEGSKQRAYVRYSHDSIESVLANNLYESFELGSTLDIPLTGNFFGLGNMLGWTSTSNNSGIKIGQSTFSFPWGVVNSLVLRPDGTVDGQLRENPVTNIGRAPFAIMQPTFQCDKFVQSLEGIPDLHLAFLWDSFGNPYDGSGNPTCLISLLNDWRMRSLQVNLINEVCVRNGNCQPYDLLYGESTSSVDQKLATLEPNFILKIRNYMSQVRQFLTDHLQPGTTCYISPGLESNLSRPASDHLVSITREEFPGCRVVYNPNGGNSNQDISGADFIEKHSNKPNFGVDRCISNNDGRDISFVSSKSSYSEIMSESEYRSYLNLVSQRCEISYIWIKEDNCRSAKSTTPPRSRICNELGRFSLATNLIKERL